MTAKDETHRVGERVAEARRQLIRRVAREMGPDEHVEAVWLAGSLGRGEGDMLSDVDLIIVMAPGRESDLAAERFEVVERFGPLALHLDSPQNAPAGGAQVNALYDFDPLPFYVDWTLWPSIGERPSDVRPLLERDPARMTMGRCIEELPAMPRGHAPELTPARLDHFRVAMLPIIAKFAARGLDDSVYRMYRVIGEPAPASADPETVVASLRGILGRLEATEPAAAIRCIGRYLDTVRMLAGDAKA